MKIYTNESLPPREMVAHALSVDEEKEKITSFCNKIKKKIQKLAYTIVYVIFFLYLCSQIAEDEKYSCHTSI